VSTLSCDKAAYVGDKKNRASHWKKGTTNFLVSITSDAETWADIFRGALRKRTLVRQRTWQGNPGTEKIGDSQKGNQDLSLSSLEARGGDWKKGSRRNLEKKTIAHGGLARRGKAFEGSRRRSVGG